MDKGSFHKLVVEIIKSAIIKNVKKEYTLDKNKIFVTEVTGCIRQSFFNRIFLGELNYNAAFRILRGVLLHEWLAEKLPIGLDEVRNRDQLRGEIDLGNGAMLVGRADYLIGDYIVELKTTSRRKLEKPLDEHVKQVMLYMHMFNKEKGIIIYLHDNGNITSFTINKEDDLIKELIEKARKLFSSLKSGHAPKAEIGQYCRWCPWNRKDFCEEGVKFSQSL
ncbi:MAG: hypothetical protein DRJ41_00680 [Thermoprotei archaeon]|nr:MAG: hypothetical protein DRJ41_00680 [Thermoprotei archaeon]